MRISPEELDLTEGRSRGIPKILRAMRANGSPLPIFETDEDRLSLLVRLRVHPDAPATPQVTPQVNALDNRPFTPQVTTQDKALKTSLIEKLAGALGLSTAQVTAQVERLLEAAKYAGTREELQSAAGMQHREHFRKAYLKPLIAARWLELTIPDKPNSRLQKYRLTEAGRAWLELS